LEIIEMKKTLIALAALAATGASFAQATMSGNLGFSWQQSPQVAADGSHAQGLSMHDGEIYITAREDLGGGMSATARGGFTMRGRGTSIADRDGTITLASPMGALTAGNLRACGPLDAVKSGAVTGPVYSSNETVLQVPLDKCALIDLVSYTSPKFSDITVNAVYGEFNDSATANQRGNTTGLTFTVLGATYAKGPIMGTADYTLYAAVKSTSQPAAGGLLTALDGWSRVRLAGTYDAGVAKLGLGYQMWTWGKADQFLASIAVPYQNMVFGIDYMGRAAQGAATKGTAAENAALDAVSLALAGTKNGDAASSALGLGATYMFSKTANVNVSYISYTDAGKNVNPTTKAETYTGKLDTEYRIRLSKSF
jgi:hypothetical protein